MSKLRSGLSNEVRRYRCYCNQHSIINGQGSIYNGSLIQIAIPGNLYEAATTRFKQ